MPDLEAALRAISKKLLKGDTIIWEALSDAFRAYHGISDFKPGDWAIANGKSVQLKSQSRWMCDHDGPIWQTECGQHYPEGQLRPEEPPTTEFKVGQWVMAEWLNEPLRKIVKIEPKYLTFDSGHTAKILGPVRPATPAEMFRPGALVRWESGKENATFLCSGFSDDLVRWDEVIFDPDYCTLLTPAPEEKE